MGDNFPEGQFVGGRFSGAQFSLGAIFCGAFFRGELFPGAFFLEPLYSHADSGANANADMTIPIFPNGHFPRFFQFHMEKKELALKMKNLYDFSYSLIHTL